MIEFTEQAMRIKNFIPLPEGYPFLNRKGVSIAKSDVDTASYIIMNKINIKGQLIACDGILLTKAISLAVQFCTDITTFQQLVRSLCVRIHIYTSLKCARSRAAELKAMRELFIEESVQTEKPIDHRDELSNDFNVKLRATPKRKDRMHTSYIGCFNGGAFWDTLPFEQRVLITAFRLRLDDIPRKKRSKIVCKVRDYLAGIEDITTSDIVTVLVMGLK